MQFDCTGRSGQEGHSLDGDEVLSLDVCPEVGVVPSAAEVAEVESILSAVEVGIDTSCNAKSFPNVLGPTAGILIDELADELEVFAALDHVISLVCLVIVPSCSSIARAKPGGP